ncbi:hypothetical protein H310_14517 [Aphanomyces invadans]|uniref:Uncharacterized protein n=1 Tax=Aphanomyces invadans TaxID=157072 RepID=A0A024T9K5_9STRA|nr:hypothetical protein H310_14517 [Aphanomyces invadans]ETV90728.1 hypothetical protein H310_14517 [Aphanomyces invadans]|eukprot:XP_008880618.1 hypothetical protein H310_14517 [Aphanomyces invadans]
MAKSRHRLLLVTSYTSPASQPTLTKLKSPKGFTPLFPAQGAADRVRVEAGCLRKARRPDYGGWSTVSVRVVDDETEQATIQAEAAAFEAKKTQIQIERDNDFLMDESLHADNAMGAFNRGAGAFQIKKGGRKLQGKYVDVSLSRATTWQLDSFTTSKWMQLVV